MSNSLSKISLVIMALAITLGFLSPCLAQVEREPRSQETVRQLHPEPVENDPPTGIKLLAGYKHKSVTDFEGNQVGEISKGRGVKIKYEIGFSQGLAVDSVKKSSYDWYQEQKVGSGIVKYALKKHNLLVISIPLSDDPTSLHAANFYGTITKPEDIADMLLMILPFAYK
jgi:hypothetical protein